jgi:hypothetical protein
LRQNVFLFEKPLSLFLRPLTDLIRPIHIIDDALLDLKSTYC